MLGGAGLELPYPWIMRNCITIHGVWKYPPKATIRLVGLIRSGLLRLHNFDAATFDLDNANEAVAQAAANGGPFKMTVIRPWSSSGPARQARWCGSRALGRGVLPVRSVLYVETYAPGVPATKGETR
jgi:hypothetical protein